MKIKHRCEETVPFPPLTATLHPKAFRGLDVMGSTVQEKAKHTPAGLEFPGGGNGGMGSENSVPETPPQVTAWLLIF